MSDAFAPVGIPHYEPGELPPLNRGYEMPSEVRQWSVGFVLDLNATLVLLIRKNRPSWQKGKLNGVGGKVEAGETPTAAMDREFKEETGCALSNIDGGAWEPMLRLWWDHNLDVTAPRKGCVHFFRAFAPLDRMRACTPGVTDEIVELHRIRDLSRPGPGIECVLPNLQWLVPLMAHRHDEYAVFDLVETGTSLRKIGRTS